MSLNWDLKSVNNMEQVCFPGGKMSDVTNNLIWATVITNLGEITEENAEEFYHRLQFSGNCSKNDWSDITLENVKAHIGLKTNVTTITWDQFVKQVATNYCRNNRFKPVKKTNKRKKV